MRRTAAVLALPTALACAAALAAPAATGCTFTGARWQQNGLNGSTYAVTLLRGATCAEAATLAGPLTRRRSLGLRTRVPAPRGWLCLSLVPRGVRVTRGDCARLGKRVAWQPTGGSRPGRGKKPPTRGPRA